MPAEQISITQPLVFLPFGATNVPDAAGNAFASEPTSLEYAMPWAGSVVAISVASNAVFTTGVLTLQPTVNGVANTALTTTLDNATQRNNGKVNVNKVPFVAGQRIGVSWTKTGTVAPLTNDLAIGLWVQLDEVRP